MRLEFATLERSTMMRPTSFIWSGRLLEMRFRWIKLYFLRYFCSFLRKIISVVKDRVSSSSMRELTALLRPTMATEFLVFMDFHSVKKREGKRRLTLACSK